MKFLCPSCKAKYQIADEKVAGRSVRMKCRKCGFMIQVSSSMPPPSGMGSEPPDASAAILSSAPPAEPETSAPVGAPPPPPRASAVSAPMPTASRPSVLPPPRPPPGKPVGTVPKPTAPPPARPPSNKTTMVGGVGGYAQSNPGAAAAPKPAPMAAEAKAAEARPRDFEDEEEVTRMADAGALAGAFSLAFGGDGDAPPQVESTLSMPGDEWFVGINGVPVGPIRLSELRSKAASGAVSKESLVWRDGFEDWRPLKTYPELVAIVEEGVSSARASLTPFTPPASDVHDPLAPKAAAAASAVDAFATSAVTSTAVVTDDLDALGLGRRRGTSPAVWIAMAIAILFGLTIGFVLFGNQKPKVEFRDKIVEVPAKGSEKAEAAAAASGATETIVAGDPQAPKKAGGPGKAPATPEADGKSGLTGLKGLSGLSGLGPSGGPVTGGPSGATGGGGQLDSGQIQSTVSRYTGSVKRRCWQPALDARARDAPMTAKVTVSITVGGSGSVQNATTTGDPRGYSGLANCIAGSVKAWQFPASGGTTVANVPFVFAGQ